MYLFVKRVDNWFAIRIPQINYNFMSFVICYSLVLAWNKTVYKCFV